MKAASTETDTEAGAAGGKAKAKVKARRQHHDEEFKREAVALLSAGRKVTQLATELGVSHWTLRDWRERYGAGAAAAGLPARSARQAPQGAASTIALSVQLADLRRELEATRRQRDILKKALAIVGQEPSNASL